MNGDHLSFLNIAVFFGSLVVSIVLHETMHAAVAYRLCDDLAKSRGRISFNPLDHIDPVLTIVMPLVFYLVSGSVILAAKPVPINASRLKGGDWGFALVAIAGPLTNFALALLAAVSLRLITPDSVFSTVVTQFGAINLSICAFNLLPIPPLDGSRVLYAVAPDFLRDLMRRFEQLGVMGVILIIVVAGPVVYPVIEEINSFLFSIISAISGI